MAEKKIRPQDKWNAAHGLVSKTYKLNSSIADGFAETCDRLGVSKKSQIEKFMQDFIEKNKSAQ